MPSVRSKKTHEDNLKVVCFFCHHKARNRSLSKSVKDYIQQKVMPEFSANENCLLKGICENCNKIACDLIKNGTSSKRKLPFQDYSETLSILKDLDLNSEACDCFACVVAQDKHPKKKPKELKIKKCEFCFSEISPGKHKKCNRSERIKNLMNEFSPKTRRQLCLETVKEETEKKNTSSPLKISSIGRGPSVAVSIESQVKSKEQ